MDEYTQKTKTWLDSRFRICDNQGIYFAHQPIYGFRKGHSESSLIDRYIRTFQIMKSLTHLKFDSLLDVGGAEGYKAFIANNLLNVKVKNSDLSEEACKRATEIFGIESIAGDIHDLPFKDNEFDVVLCSETLEHVTEYHKAVAELLRVANKAVVITVPHENQKIIDKNIKKEPPHGHIQNLNLVSFNYLKSEGYDIKYRKIISPLLVIPKVLVEAMPREYKDGMKYPKIFFRVYNSLVPLLRKLFNEKQISFLIRLDEIICRFTWHNATLFIVLKDNKCYTKKENLEISACQIVSFAVPFHHIQPR